MLARCLLVALAVCAVTADHHGDHAHHDHGDHPRITCADITPLKEVDFPAMTGNWVAVESILYRDGHPFAPSAEEDKRAKTCVYVKNTGSSVTSLTAKLESHYPGQETVVETNSITSVGEGEKGRLSIHSDLHDRDNWEFLIIDADPTKYMVYVMCLPPNEAGERLPARVHLVSRHADHSDHEVITADEELQIETRIGEKLKLAGSGVKPVRFSHDCWASYAEPQ